MTETRITGDCSPEPLAHAERKPLPPAARRALAEAEARRKAAEADPRPMPKELQGSKPALGNYLANASGTLMVSPDLQGMAAWVDTCRNYAAVIIVEKPQEEKKPIYQNLINLVGEAIGGACQ